MTRFLGRAALAIAVVTVAAVAPVAPAAAQAPGTEPAGTLGIRLVDAPVERAGDPRARNYVIDHLNPGQAIQRRVEVHNDTNGEVTVALYAASASVEGGRFLFGENRAQNELTAWTSVTPSSLTLSSGDRATATVTIAVGNDATRGEHYGVVWAQARSEAPDGGVATVHRVGVRVYLSVGPGGEPPSDFEIRSLTAARDAQGRPYVKAEVENTGQRALDLTGRLELGDGPGGLKAGPFPMELGTTLAPGDTAPATVFLDPELPDGPWAAVVTVSSGRLEKLAQAEITFPTGSARAAAPVPAQSLATEGVDLLRVSLAGGIALLVGGGLLLILFGGRRRRRDREEGQRPDPAVSAPRRRHRRRPLGLARAGRPRRPRPDRRSVARRRGGAPAPAARGRRLPEPPDRAEAPRRSSRQARPPAPAR